MNVGLFLFAHCLSYQIWHKISPIFLPLFWTKTEGWPGSWHVIRCHKGTFLKQEPMKKNATHKKKSCSSFHLLQMLLFNLGITFFNVRLIQSDIKYGCCKDIDTQNIKPISAEHHTKFEWTWQMYHSMARANLNKSEELVTSMYYCSIKVHT